jgi:hypothetical protein
MKIINGKPAIAFYDLTHTRLQYLYALDAQGNLELGSSKGFSFERFTINIC